MDLCNRRDVSLLSSRSSPAPSLFRLHTCLPPLTRKPPSPVPLPTMGAAALHRRATGSPFADPSPQRQGLGGWRTPPPPLCVMGVRRKVHKAVAPVRPALAALNHLETLRCTNLGVAELETGALSLLPSPFSRVRTFKTLS